MPKMPQPMRPSGLAGRVFGFVMERVAAPNYRWVLARLAPYKPRACLEIGFGTGRLMQLVAGRIAPARICGVDPSELMLQTARKRLSRFAETISVDLRPGDDTKLAWPDASFDAIIASHSFQFWVDPCTTLKRLRTLLRPNGRLLLVVRSHISPHVQGWIPNPITKSGRELEGLRAALVDAGFRIIIDEKLSTGSQGIEAACA